MQEFEWNNSTKENKVQINAIENRLANLVEVLRNSPTTDAKKIKNRSKLLEIVENILHFNQPNQKESGLKVLTPSQMLNKLPISLAQLNAENNSEKLKNEITQLLYSLYRSKTFTKNIYKTLVDII